jgi:hypothetical protein
MLVDAKIQSDKVQRMRVEPNFGIGLLIAEVFLIVDFVYCNVNLSRDLIVQGWALGSMGIGLLAQKLLTIWVPPKTIHFIRMQKNVIGKI